MPEPVGGRTRSENGQEGRGFISLAALHLLAVALCHGQDSRADWIGDHRPCFEDEHCVRREWRCRVLGFAWSDAPLMLE